MSYVSYKYGLFKKDITKLLQKRLDLKHKVWHCNNKIKQYENEIKEIEKQIKNFESMSN